MCKFIEDKSVSHDKILIIMTAGPAGNSEFCFPSTSMFPEVKGLKKVIQNINF